ncbi:hypothetical protein KOR34_38800 [Posidoniimonas corsicana]|uniref:Autotransporter-associated beta strand repeat protein n=1 Tax=Posidoniimonas corsicana TaxID=1938618 RepID=A0A5C5V648_9BACT|nr:hypothetical protein [Posidoniimonas corsicana]TWT34044.1 hypothetical protein KOR34_38800 [Posidoniimonas corsicana]
MQRLALVIAAWCVSGLAASVAQTVINVPPDADPGAIGADTILNLGDGGVLADGFTAGEGSLLNIDGGATQGLLVLDPGSVANFRGGAFADGLIANQGSSVALYGGDFRVDGVPVPTPDGAPVVIPDQGLLSGTLADGVPFAFSRQENPSRLNADFTFVPTELPAIGPTLITASTDLVPAGIRAGQTLVVDDGAVVGDNFNAGWGSTVHIQPGGQVGRNLEAVGATINMTGGVTAGAVELFHGATLNMSDGHLSPSNDVFSGGRANLSGGTVPLIWVWRDGYLAATGAARVVSLRYFAGASIEVDGNAVVNSLEFQRTNECCRSTTVDIRGGAVASPVEFAGPGAITMSGGEAQLLGVGPGQSLRMSGGSTGSISIRGGAVDISGGSVTRGLSITEGSAVEVSGGVIGPDTLVWDGATLSVTGGEFDEGFLVDHGGAATITGGRFGDRFRANAGSVVSIQNAEIGDQLRVEPGATVTITDSSLGMNADVSGVEIALHGQSIGSGLFATDSSIEMRGGSLGAGALIRESTVLIEDADVGEQFEARASDVWIANSRLGRWFRAPQGGELSLVSVESPGNLIAHTQRARLANVTIGPNTAITVSSQPGSGEITDSTFGENTSLVGDIHVSGSSFGDDLNMQFGRITLNGQSIGEGALIRAELNLLDGVIGSGLRTVEGFPVDIAGGRIEEGYVAANGPVNQTGGEIAGNVLFWYNVPFTMSGGAIGDGLNFYNGAQLNLIGSGFALDGAPIEGLTPGERVEIDARDVTLSGTLADGSPVEFLLDPNQNNGGHYIPAGAMVTVTLFEGLPGDFNGDAVVDAADYTVWRDSLGQIVGFGEGADHNFSGRIDDGDLYVWRNNYGRSLASSAPVPEPASALLTIAAVLAAPRRRAVGRLVRGPL